MYTPASGKIRSVTLPTSQCARGQFMLDYPGRWRCKARNTAYSCGTTAVILIGSATALFQKKTSGSDGAIQNGNP
jgi:hypothetical protein